MNVLCNEEGVTLPSIDRIGKVLGGYLVCTCMRALCVGCQDNDVFTNCLREGAKDYSAKSLY
jgi:hypothetical protein